MASPGRSRAATAQFASSGRGRGPSFAAMRASPAGWRGDRPRGAPRPQAPSCPLLAVRVGSRAFPLLRRSTARPGAFARARGTASRRARRVPAPARAALEPDHTPGGQGVARLRFGSRSSVVSALSNSALAPAGSFRCNRAEPSADRSRATRVSFSPSALLARSIAASANGSTSSTRLCISSSNAMLSSTATTLGCESPRAAIVAFRARRSTTSAVSGSR